MTAFEMYRMEIASMEIAQICWFKYEQPFLRHSLFDFAWLIEIILYGSPIPMFWWIWLRCTDDMVWYEIGNIYLMSDALNITD